MKKVARPLYFSNNSITFKVLVLCGPSSKVIATIFLLVSICGWSAGLTTSNGALEGIFLFASFIKSLLSS